MPTKTVGQILMTLNQMSQHNGRIQMVMVLAITSLVLIQMPVLIKSVIQHKATVWDVLTMMAMAGIMSSMNYPIHQHNG